MTTNPATSELKLPNTQRYHSENLFADLLAHVTPDAENLARNLLTDSGSLNGVVHMTREALLTIPGMTEAIADFIRSQAVMVTRLAEEKLYRPRTLSSLDDVKHYLWTALAWEHSCYYLVVYMNRYQRMIRSERLFRGNAHQVYISPREIARGAAIYNATTVITGQNHVGKIHWEQMENFYHVRAALNTIGVKHHDHYLVDPMGVQSVQADLNN